ncbi:TPR-like protein, partial [Cadophora sp. DSE1049]
MKSHPARNLAIASIGFLEKSLKDGSADWDHIQTAIERISRCFKIEDRDSSEEVNLLAIFTDYEKQRTAVFKSQGNSHMKIHLFHEAIESYTKALELDPYNPILLRNRSVAYTKIASKEKARTDAENAVAMDPHFAPAWSQLGYIRYWIGDSWGSMEAYQTAINLCGGSEKDKKGLE